MGTITTADGTEIYYKDWGEGQPIVFSHGWPLSADDWDTQMLFFLQHGYRVIAHDRRGHGRSSQPGDGHDMDHYADDLAALTAHLDLRDAIHVGHSTGGGEVAHYLGRHGESRVAKAVLISAVPPLMVKTAANPGGLPKEVFDDLQAQLAANRSQFYRDLPSGPFYGFNRPGAKASEAIIQNWWRQGMMGGSRFHDRPVLPSTPLDPVPLRNPQDLSATRRARQVCVRAYHACRSESCRRYRLGPSCEGECRPP
jgi:non-heme chloroperoxidase